MNVSLTLASERERELDNTLSVRAGQKLGKYKLIEKVGQGGMAVVYRGIDNSLNREVAVKILHSHLADNEEARARFGREAHAVAKLRHENILEIHDFSGVDSAENYIVTEFIDGCTLREFTSDHAIHFPEVGAMITVQLCRALAHAHGLGVLHRDVKPENIMIRCDGVVKLTDFGISQMVDLQRMTVTGQLLGSPAYMSPEHVRGGMLDFRTDVFAVGIVLYQLVTGDLPFQGKNPHEILKRIADCVYPDPTRANPRVGTQLGRIINTALAAEKDDRYADISLMQQALDEYLEGSGLNEPRSELERFFEAPASYQMALEKRLVDYLSERGRSLQANGKSVEALELFNRVLSIDEENAEVLGLLRGMGAKKRYIRIAAIAVGLCMLAGLSLIAKKRFAKQPSGVANLQLDSGPPLNKDASPPSADATVAIAVVVLPPDAGVAIADAGKVPKVIVPRRRKFDAGSSKPIPALRMYRLSLFPGGSEYRIGNGPWHQAASGTVQIQLPEDASTLSARNTSCCQERRIGISSDDNAGRIDLKYLPAQVTPTCGLAGVRVKINGKNARVGRAATIPVVRLTGTESITVEFISDDKVDSHRVTAVAAKQMDVACRF